MKKFPKVLIISEFSFNKVTGGGILFTNLFKDFPIENIALIHEDLKFDNRNLKFSICIKSRKKIISYLLSFLNPKFKEIIKSALNLFKKNISTPPISLNVQELVQNFKPDMIYTILGHQDMMEFIKKIKEKYNLPLVTHIMDNIIDTDEEKNSYTIDLFNYFIKKSITLIAINKKMAEVYSKRYLKKFNVIHNGLIRNKIRPVCNEENSKNRITYIGSIYENAQLRSIIKISEAVISLSKEGMKICFYIYLPKHQISLFSFKLKNNKCIKFRENNLNDYEYFYQLSKSNLLILASNFDKKSINYYKYSWPAKMPSYLMSGIPIFIFGPNDIFFISEAKKKKWALVCSDNDQVALENSIKKILFDKKFKNNTVKYALKESKNFELELIKKEFLKLLIKTKN